MCTSLFLLLSLPLSSLSPLGSNSSHCATPTPTPCDHLPPPTKTPFPYPGHPPFPAFVAAPLLLPHLSRPVHPPRGTGTPIPHTRLQEGWFAPPSSGAPCQAACTAHPTLQLMPILLSPIEWLSDGRKEELIPSGLWVTPKPRPRSQMDQQGLFVSCCRN